MYVPSFVKLSCTDKRTSGIEKFFYVEGECGSCPISLIFECLTRGTKYYIIVHSLVWSLIKEFQRYKLSHKIRP